MALKAVEDESSRREFSRRLAPARLYLNDLEDIVSDLRRECRVVNLWAGSRLAEEVSDLADAKWTERRRFRIETREPAVVVNFRGRTVRAPNPTPEATLMVTHVEDLVRVKKPTVSWLSATQLLLTVGIVVYLVFAIVYVLLLPGTPLGGTDGRPGAATSVVVYSAGILVFSVALASSLRSKGMPLRIVFARRSEHGIFTAKNRAAWYIGAITGAVGLVVGTAIGYWISPR